MENITLYDTTIRYNKESNLYSLTDVNIAYNKHQVNINKLPKTINTVINDINIIPILHLIVTNIEKSKITLDELTKLSRNNNTIKTLKKLNIFKTTGAKENKNTQTDLHIILTILHQIDNKLYSDLKSLTNPSPYLINRIEAGVTINSLLYEITTFKSHDFLEVNKEINKAIFGIENPNPKYIRKNKELKHLEQNLAFAVNMNYIKDQKDLINTIKWIRTIKTGETNT